MGVTIGDLRRNDLAQAEAYYREHRPISDLEWRALCQLQDDPAAFERLSKGWEIKPSVPYSLKEN
jgi:hypothetical protein